MNRNTISTTPKKEKAFLMGVTIGNRKGSFSLKDSLDELAFLSETAGLDVVGSESQILSKPNPATYIGSGKANDVKLLAQSLSANVVVFDVELSPRNFRELEESFGIGIRVIDRTTLILDIFGQHAQTREGKLQVELAQYEYILPRLTKAWSHLARQSGGGGGRTGNSGGVGLRGPGETQLEVDRRTIRNKISRLKKEIEKIRQHRQRYRKNRKSSQMPTISLVGYTNAGKSTLLNILTKSDVYVADKLFATLDPTTRRLALPSGNTVLITDTVGFIQKLPTHLIAAFRATLEEISESDLLIHVLDITHPNFHAQYKSVIETLEIIGANPIPMITALNKIDKNTSEKGIVNPFPQVQESFPISAKMNLGIEGLLNGIDHTLFKEYTNIKAKIPYKNGRIISLFHQYGIVEKVEHGVGSVVISGKIPGRMVADFERFQSKAIVK